MPYSATATQTALSYTADCCCVHLLLAEARSLLDCVVHLFNQLLVAAVRRQVKSVEARVTARQPRLLANFLNTEMLRTIAP